MITISDLNGIHDDDAKIIADLIMQAMNYDCCKYFAGANHSLDDFHKMMTQLVMMDESQYSYRNTIVAKDDHKTVGILICYDGALLHPLRRAFIHEAKLFLEKDFSDIDDETAAGELYLDSLAVNKQYRNKGIATMLLKAGIRRAGQMNIDKVGLLVDKGNPGAEKLYTQLGFKYINDTKWGGHEMKHLQYDSFFTENL